MTNRQKEILTAINQGKKLPVEICESTGRAKADVSNVLMKMLDIGFVSVSFDPLDARRRVYSLTLAGENALQQA